MQPRRMTRCPVCERVKCYTYSVQRDASGYDCEACGKYEISRTARINDFKPDRKTLIPRESNLLFQRLNNAFRNGHITLIDTHLVEGFKNKKLRFPTPFELINKAILTV